jgi:putative oxidoreductase
LRYLDRSQPLALVVLRLVLGSIMIAHGRSKVFGGMAHAVQFVSSLGLPGWMAYLSAYTEFFGGILIILGLFTRVVALGIVIDMLVAIGKVHWKKGLVGPGASEFPLSLAAISFALIFFGAGSIAIDAIRRGGGGAGKKSL